MHMTDLSPSAVMCGIGKVVRELTTVPTRKSTYSFTEDVTAYLPYVEMVNNERDFDSSCGISQRTRRCWYSPERTPRPRVLGL